MSSRHLGCAACRIRLHATAPEIDLLEGMCPVCGMKMKLASSVSDLTGFRLFDLSPLSDQEPRERANMLGRPVDPVARREGAVADAPGVHLERAPRACGHPPPPRLPPSNPAEAAAH